MATYLAPNHSFSINKPTEPQVLLLDNTNLTAEE